MSPIIEINNLSKGYSLPPAARQGYRTIRDHFGELLTGAISGRRDRASHGRAAFWALSNVCAHIETGEVVGIIGRNGAGKSTLLKVLSRITAPTCGEAILRGRVGALLEVGTGFHPELTGRENIYLNGTILGLRPAEIRAKFDEIVAFSEVERFLDLPIKRYSSGMQMRLAFSVAAHLEPDILIVDEVLAVGDVAFQRKCLGKVSDIAQSGRTVVLVSHNIDSVSQLCSKAIWLDAGKVRMCGTDVANICRSYLGSSMGHTARGEYPASPGELFTTEFFDLLRFRVHDEGGRTISTPVPKSSGVNVELLLDIKRTLPSLSFGFALHDSDGRTIFWTTTTDGTEPDWPRIHPGIVHLACVIPPHLLNEGDYIIDFFSALQFERYLSEPLQTPVRIRLQIAGHVSQSPYWTSRRPGPIAPILSWRVLPKATEENRVPHVGSHNRDTPSRLTEEP